MPKSIGLNLNCVSVLPYVIGLVLNACNFVAHATPPGARLLSANGNAALQVDDVNGPACVPGDVGVAPGTVNNTFTTIESGFVPLEVFEMRSAAVR